MDMNLDQKIIELKKKGIPNADIASELNVTFYKIKTVCKKAGLKLDKDTAIRNAQEGKLKPKTKQPAIPQKKQKYTEKQYDQACELRQQGMAIKEISTLTEVGIPALKKLFKDRKIILTDEQYKDNVVGSRWIGHEPVRDGKKQCSKCKEWKLLAEFHVNNNRLTGTVSECKECADDRYMENPEPKRQYANEYRSNNLESIKASQALYYEDNSEHIINNVTIWQLANPDKVSGYHKTYRQNNQKHKNFKTARYRAAKDSACPNWLTEAQLKEMDDFYKNCPEGYCVDHIEPLRAELSCGLDVPWNLQYLPRFANESKSNSPELDIKKIGICHQKIVKDKYLEEDAKAGYPTNLKASEFSLQTESFSGEHRAFIERYEWLGTVGYAPKWVFTARHNGLLGAVVMIGEPVAYSTLGPEFEAQIQRGATASWTPKNLGSRIIMFACRWMVQNTSKRLFIGYSDPEANEIGTIYQACNFEYVGGWYGSKKNFILPTGKIVGSRYFTKTSSMVKWAKDLDIQLLQEWFVGGRLKPKLIPKDVKIMLNNYANMKKFECEISIPKPKGKYYLLLPKDKREKAKLDQLRSWDSLPYPKRKS